MRGRGKGTVPRTTPTLGRAMARAGLDVAPSRRPRCFACGCPVRRRLPQLASTDAGRGIPRFLVCPRHLDGGRRERRTRTGQQEGASDDSCRCGLEAGTRHEILLLAHGSLVAQKLGGLLSGTMAWGPRMASVPMGHRIMRGCD
jgi:hypothetical protein